MSEGINEEDYLKKHLQDNDYKEPAKKADPINMKDNSRVSDLQYFSFESDILPLGKFYDRGTTIMVRAAQTKEIQSYSMVDDTNFYDMVEKMNDMLSACVRVKYADGSMSSYLDIKDGDRVFLIFLIRELTFQKGNNLTVKSNCKCGTEVTIELHRNNFVMHDMPETIEPYFDQSSNVFRFETIKNDVFELGPPSIGLQKSFTEYIIKEYNEKKTPNLSFLKIIPFTMSDRNNITIEGIKKKLNDFQNMDDTSFQFLNSAVNKMTLGIKELKKKCSCGLEVATDMTFPDGPSAIFVIHDAFDKFIKK